MKQPHPLCRLLLWFFGYFESCSSHETPWSITTPIPIEKYTPLAYQQDISSFSSPRHSQISPRQQIQKEGNNQSQAQSLEYPFFSRSSLFVSCSTFPTRSQASRYWLSLAPSRHLRRRIWHPIFRPPRRAFGGGTRRYGSCERVILALMGLVEGGGR